MENKPKLYGDIVSPPVRFVMMTASYVGVQLDFHKIDLFRGEHKSDFYTKINPLQKVPALSVGNETIRDSHAIALYLCKKSENKILYPDDPLTKAKVDQMLFFHSGCLFPVDKAIFSAYFAGKWPVNEEQINQWNFLLDYLNDCLEKNKWLAGEKMTLCDVCCAATVSSLQLLLKPSGRHGKINKWLENIKAFPMYSENIEGLKVLQHFINQMEKKSKT